MTIHLQPGQPVRSVLWYSPVLPSMERCVLYEDAFTRRFEGTVLTIVDNGPAEIRYVVNCDATWRTRNCTVRVENIDNSFTVTLAADERGAWTRNGVPVREFDGIFDVDLGFSPCTNTLAIRRLALEVGQSRRLTVAWFRFPELDVVRAEQVYTRLDEHVYRFETGAGDFAARLETDDIGIVTRFGDLWRELIVNSWNVSR